jgi:phosphotriesterase-related protein
MTMKHARALSLSRREAMRLLGVGAGLGLVTACTPGSGPQTETATESAAPSGSSALTFPEGAIVRTILGDVAPEQLSSGATLFHEHVSFSYSSPPPRPPSAAAAPGTPPPPSESGAPPAPPDNAEMLDLVVEELRMAAFDGVRCIVDSSTGPRTQQQLENLKALATRSGMHIVLGGGYFLAPRYPPEIIRMTEQAIADHLVEQAGLERWGAFGEIGTSMPDMHGDERKFLHSVSRAHVRTGLPIFTHVPHQSCPSCAREQLDIYESEGVDLSHLCIGHLTTIKGEDDPGWETHRTIAKRGAFLGFDTVGHEMSQSFIPETEKVKMVLRVIEAGYEDKLLLSSDFANTRQIKANWGNGFSTVLVQFVPKLRYAGVPEATIRKILVDNPRRFLSFVPKSA